MAVTTEPNECLHSNQRQLNGVWVCKLCGVEVPLEPTAAEDFAGIRFNGMDALRIFRDFGKTEREMTRDNIERFRKERGYDPEPVDRGRWI